MRLLLLLLSLSSHSFAQYLTTDDGSRLFFTSSDRLAGAGQSFRSKIFSWNSENGVQLVYESPSEYVCCLSITGDGSLAAFILDTAEQPSRRSGALLDVRTGKVEIVGSDAIISRNGRYIFNGHSLLDRLTNASRPAPVQSRFVGSDGSLLYRDSKGLHRIDPDGTDRVVFGGLRSGQILDASENTTAATVLPEMEPPVVVDTLTEQLVDLRTVGARPDHPAAYLSRDGRWVTFAGRRSGEGPVQLMLCRTDATDCRILKTPWAPIAISGDAKAVYTGQEPNDVIRIAVDSGRIDRAFGIATFWPLVEAPLVPGSLVRFYAVNAGNHITVNGQEVPLLSSPAGLPLIQLPWELPDKWVKFTMYGGTTPFETFTRTYPVFDFFPVGFPPGNPQLNEGQPAYRQDWSSTTYQSPATPGEVVHIYMVGLGPVDCPIQTGNPAPVDRLCRVTRAAGWKWTTAPDVVVPAEVLFAGLAPGIIGLYQVDVRVPPYQGYEYIELSDGQNPRVAAIRIRPQ